MVPITVGSSIINTHQKNIELNNNKDDLDIYIDYIEFLKLSYNKAVGFFEVIKNAKFDIINRKNSASMVNAILNQIKHSLERASKNHEDLKRKAMF